MTSIFDESHDIKNNNFSNLNDKQKEKSYINK